ncbi:hypothetical protein [Mucilaginibacter flavidus]|uniref:hypothetical protein n=1 Tax=Mucilaginibacter flavidus TaxID=2949309 RepID=UPI002092ACF9|nr:hypothetical protein [Mucilaginibacter flavidus]MCO5948300.1 hypothetical protein [Mucilaginibacter flavidus]
MDLRSVDINCHTDQLDGYIVFHIRLTNETSDTVQFISNDFPNYGYTGFYLLSNRFDSGAVRLQASEMYKLVNVPKNKAGYISLIATVGSIIKQFDKHDKPPRALIKDFLTSNDYKLIYVNDSVNNKDFFKYQGIKDANFKVDCFDEQLVK